jgi:hypothetical protein
MLKEDVCLNNNNNNNKASTTKSIKKSLLSSSLTLNSSENKMKSSLTTLTPTLTPTTTTNQTKIETEMNENDLSPNIILQKPINNNKNFRRIAQISQIFSVNSDTTNNNKNDLQKLTTKLDSFLIKLPELPIEKQFTIQSFHSSILELDADWTQFYGIHKVNELPLKIVKQQMAIWELLATECSHIKTLKVIIDVFLSCLIQLKTTNDTGHLFADIEINKLFLNIIDIFNCNLTFWYSYLYPIVKDVKSSDGHLIHPSSLLDGFSKFNDLFFPYEQYCLDKNKSMEYFKQKINQNEFFAKFITVSFVSSSSF